MSDITFDFQRRERIGLGEAVLCAGKTPQQIGEAIALAQARSTSLLLTRLTPDMLGRLAPAEQASLDYDPRSHTAILGRGSSMPGGAPPVAVVTAGTSDLPVAREAVRTLAFYGVAAREIADVGVAGLWRILRHEEELRRYPVVIVVAGMEGALFSVLAGLVGGVVIAVPTSTGYGAARQGETALHAALASCAPGLVTVNIDNGYGAASAALRVLAGHRHLAGLQAEPAFEPGAIASPAD
ncbi:MAG: larB [Geminicoccaceae bacterium]|nr:larB [Geminicoccaceae bacterium]